MQAWLVSTGIVALAEIGDKTQLLAFVLAARYRKPLPIVLGILVATLLNHALAGALGSLIVATLSPQTLRWLLGASFLAMAGWALIPDKFEQDQAPDPTPRWGVFVATTVAFFIVEMGDKTQVATIALAARFDDIVAVVAGTTIGMMLANAPAVFIGERIAHKLPVRAIHMLVAALFALLGIWVILGGGMPTP
ncbi:MAG: TMEM165/GDT1 family protein [Quisquiliibacterium sp.]|jgi:putative Ca2+/H+ antiporter (TMEM165/GDT1 family)